MACGDDGVGKDSVMDNMDNDGGDDIGNDRASRNAYMDLDNDDNTY